MCTRNGTARSGRAADFTNSHFGSWKHVTCEARGEARVEAGRGVECNRGSGRAWVEEEEAEELMRCLIEGPVSSELRGSQLSLPGLTWDREVMR